MSIPHTEEWAGKCRKRKERGHGMKNPAKRKGKSPSWRGSKGPGRHRVGLGEGPRAGGTVQGGGGRDREGDQRR